MEHQASSFKTIECHRANVETTLKDQTTLDQT